MIVLVTTLANASAKSQREVASLVIDANVTLVAEILVRVAAGAVAAVATATATTSVASTTATAATTFKLLYASCKFCASALSANAVCFTNDVLC